VVANLTRNVTEAHVKEIFSQYGPIKCVACACVDLVHQLCDHQRPTAIKHAISCLKVLCLKVSCLKVSCLKVSCLKVWKSGVCPRLAGVLDITVLISYYLLTHHSSAICSVQHVPELAPLTFGSISCKQGIPELNLILSVPACCSPTPGLPILPLTAK
jgi:hypothetical protein